MRDQLVAILLAGRGEESTPALATGFVDMNRFYRRHSIFPFPPFVGQPRDFSQAPS